MTGAASQGNDGREPLYGVFTPEVINVTRDGRSVRGELAVNREADPSEIRDMVADATGLSPDAVHISTGENNQGSRGTKRSFGFSKWGANWEPAGPSGGDPTLN